MLSGGMRKPYRLLPLLVVLALPLKGQRDTVLHLPLVQVRADSAAPSPPATLLTLDRETLRGFAAGDMGALLAAKGGVFVKDYGAGNLSTLSVRGLAAQHTSLEWNGFRLESPMNGLQDLRLLPPALFEGLLLEGVGLHPAPGGALALVNEAPLGKGFGLEGELGAGSYGWLLARTEALLSGSTLGTRLSLLHQRAENDYPLLPEDTSRLSHARFRQSALLHSLSFRPTPRLHLRTHLWWQEASRNIPPSRTETSSRATQHDEALRLALHGSWAGASSHSRLGIAVLHEGLDYRNPGIDSSDNRTTSVQVRAEHQRPGWQPSHRLQLALGSDWQAARSTAFAAPEARHRLETSLRYRLPLFREAIRLSALLRQEWTDGKPLPTAPALTLQGRALKRWHWSLDLARTYRLPTLNDLFFQSAFATGNPALRTEKGWQGSLSLTYRPALNWSLKGVLFTTRLDDWILWQPEGTRWRPENLRSVWARGLELSLRHQLPMAGGTLHLQSRYHFTRSTLRAAESGNEHLLGKQLIYTPVHQANFELRWQRGSWLFSLLHSLTGERHTTTDNRPSDALPPFLIGQLSLRKSFPLTESKLEAALHLFNLWNTPYEIIAARPMPPRHFRLSLRWKLDDG